MIVRGVGGEAVLGVYNEFMTADVDSERVATFPDMIGTLDPWTGEPIAISELPVGSEVAVVIAHRSKFPVGKGALDPAVFPRWRRRWASICVHISDLYRGARRHVASL